MSSQICSCKYSCGDSSQTSRHHHTVCPGIYKKTFNYTLPPQPLSCLKWQSWTSTSLSQYFVILLMSYQNINIVQTNLWAELIWDIFRISD